LLRIVGREKGGLGKGFALQGCAIEKNHGRSKKEVPGTEVLTEKTAGSNRGGKHVQREQKIKRGAVGGA